MLIFIKMEQITFLLGAGASFNCVPTVANMAGGIAETAAHFEALFNNRKNSDLMAPQITLFQKLLDDLKWLKNICDTERNFSVDTYAKKLKIAGRIDEYEKLKTILTIFFTLRQLHKLPDVRYDNFWASLIDSKDTFPGHVKILSWNYDFQLELTFRDFLGTESLKDSASHLNTITPKHSSDAYKPADKFTIFKINGSATYSTEFSKYQSSFLIDELRTKNDYDQLHKIMDFHQKALDGIIGVTNNLSFAWEHNKDGTYFKHLIDCVKGTTILVVIGYSFPFFNRETDKLIFNDSMPALRKVYFQAPEEDVNAIKERFQAIRNTVLPENLVSRTDLKQFVLPNEL